MDHHHAILPSLMIERTELTKEDKVMFRWVHFVVVHCSRRCSGSGGGMVIWWLLVGVGTHVAVT